MKQLYCTSSASEQGAIAARVRAASPGLEPERRTAALRYAGYTSPARDAGDGAAAPPPTRLALLHTPDAGRLLCHSTCLGIEAATGKNGHFFTHLLLDVPSTLDAQQAIQSWGSHLWQRTDPGGGADLPEALYLPVSSTLGDAELHRFLAQPANRDLLEFLLAALLTPRGGRIFVAAPVEVVALCIYGITRVLPQALLEDFTFSTYEREPFACPARLVGTCWDEAPDHDLPAACYEAPHVAYNTYSGRKSVLAGEHPFVAFALNALGNGQPAPLDEFHATWQRLGVKDADFFELVFRMARGTGTLSKEESQRVLHHPTLSSWMAVRPDALRQFLEWALDDQGYATATFSRAVTALRQKPETLAKLAQTVQERGLAALRDGDLVRTRNALEALMPMVAPARASAVWHELLTTIADPDALTWDLRCYLLPRLVRLKPLAPGQTPEPALERWLRISAERLAAVLALNLPQTYQVAVCLTCLGQEGEPTPTLARTLAAHPALVLAALQRLPAQPDGEGRAEALFQAVVMEAPGQVWVEELLRHGRTLPAPLVDRCLDWAVQNGKVLVPALVRGHGPALLELLAHRPSLDRIARLLLAGPIDDGLADPAVDTFLRSLSGAAGLGDEARSRLDAYLGSNAFLRQPALDGETLGRVTAALRLEPPLFPPPVRERVLAALASAWGARAGSDGVQADLELLLRTVGPAWPGGATGLYRDLLLGRREDRWFWKQADLIQALLGVALGAPQSPELASQLDNLDAEAYILAQQTARLGGARVLAALDQRTETWPRAARSQWGFLAKAVQPRGFRARFRDGCLVAAGGLAGAVGVLVLQWLHVI